MATMPWIRTGGFNPLEFATNLTISADHELVDSEKDVFLNVAASAEGLTVTLGIDPGQTMVITNTGSNAVTLKNVSGDSGHSLAAGSYVVCVGSSTPNGSTWSSGSGGGGGGSIETAEVTFINAATDGSDYAVFVPFQTSPIIVSSIPVTVEFPLYGEDALYFLWGDQVVGIYDESFPPEITGDISWTDNGFAITGDGTLTMKTKNNGGEA